MNINKSLIKTLCLTRALYDDNIGGQEISYAYETAQSEDEFIGIMKYYADNANFYIDETGIDITYFTPQEVMETIGAEWEQDENEYNEWSNNYDKQTNEERV